MHDFQRYRLVSRLGEGAMGVVWLAEDAATGERVALKVITGALSATADARTQFKQEFRLMAQLRHPNCCAVYDYGLSPDGEPFFTMEVVPGKGLDELLPLPPDRFEDLFAQLMLALGYVHQLGFVHRDLKPANVRVTPEGVVKLMDYGLMESGGSAGGPVRGTLAYLAPEVLKRGPIDRRTDLYAAGALAYELLTGRPPFVGTKPLDVILAHLGQRPEAPGRLRPGVAPKHERVALKLLEKEPIARFQSTGEVLSALGREAPSGIGGNLLASPMVGRDDALAGLAGRLTAVSRREAGAAIALGGPAGAGKTRLLEEFRFMAQLAEVPCGYVRAREGDLAPYGPAAALLRALLPALQAAVPGDLATHGPVVSRLVPEASDAIAPPLAGPLEEKARLEGAFVALLASLASAAGLVVLVDGWEWMDPLSVALFDRLLRASQGAPLLFVAAGRGQAADGATPFEHWPLAPLAETAVGRMIASMLGQDAVASAFVGRLTALAAGNPLYLERLLDHLVKQGQLVRREGAWATDIAIADQAVPANLEALLRARLATLSDDARAVARAAAVLGHGFDLALLDAVTGLGPERTFDALRELAGHHVLAQDEDGTWGFAQVAMQVLLAGELEPAERAQAHGAAGRTLEARLAGRPSAEASVAEVTAIAHHALRAGDAAATIRFALEAGRRHAALFANDEAARYLQAGLVAARAQGGPDDAGVRLDYLEALGDVLRVDAREAAARDAYLEALPLARAAGDRARAGRLLASLARALQALHELPEARRRCDEAVETSLAAGDAGNAARALLTGARIRSFQGDDAGALADAERAVALAGEAGERAKVAEGLAFLGYRQVVAVTGRAADGMANLEAAIALYEDLGERIGLAGAYTMLGDAQATGGEYLAARASFLRSRALCEDLGYRHELTFVLLNLAGVDLALGEPVTARAHATEAHALARALANRYAVGVAEVELARAEAALDPSADVIGRIDDALAIASDLGHAYLESYARQAAVELHLDQGRADDARAALETFETAGYGDADGRMALDRARLQGLLGDPQGGLGHARRALALAISTRARGVQARALLVCARFEHELGRPDEARRLADEARALAESLGARPLADEAAALIPAPRSAEARPAAALPLGIRPGMMNM